MTYPEVLDLREIAGEWRDALEDGEDRQLADYAESCESLCGDLGVDPTPDALERWANDYEPTLVAEEDFPAYAEQLAEELGLLPESNQWPAYCIDWERAARDLAMDYTSVRFNGNDYYIRSV